MDEKDCEFYNEFNGVYSCNLYELSDFNGEPIYTQCNKPQCELNTSCYYRQLKLKDKMIEILATTLEQVYVHWQVTKKDEQIINRIECTRRQALAELEAK